MKRIVPKTYTSLDAVGIPASGVGKASVEETREVKQPVPDPKRKLDLTAGPYKGGTKSCRSRFVRKRRLTSKRVRDTMVLLGSWAGKRGSIPPLKCCWEPGMSR